MDHSALYRSVLHRSEYELPARFLETLGVYTSMTNGCDYDARIQSPALL